MHLDNFRPESEGYLRMRGIGNESDPRGHYVAPRSPGLLRGEDQLPGLLLTCVCTEDCLRIKEEVTGG